LGDCLKVMKDIDDKSIDLILCDLPYGTTRNKWDVVIPFDNLWEQYCRIIKDKGVIVLTASQPFTSFLIMSNQEIFRYSLVWNKNFKTGFLNARKMPLRQHEDILIFYKKSGVYNPQFTEGKPYITRRKSPATENYNSFKPFTTINKGVRYPSSIININSVANGSEEKCKHSTQKPVALFEYLIKTYTNENAVVLDKLRWQFYNCHCCDQYKPELDMH
jgi:site-specific DNA-methyltransferase (adenine-specific)